MHGRFATALGAIACACALALVGAATAQAQEPPVQVLLYHGPSDARTDAGVAAIEALGAANNFGVEATDDATAFTSDNLENYRAVIFLNTSGDILTTPQETALQSYIEDGGGFFGIGEVAAAEQGNSFFTGLLGARPSGNSSGATTPQIVAVGDRVHPSTEDLPLEWARSDIWYQWQTRPTGQVHTVARYRAPNAPAGDGTNVGGTDHPISWCRDYEGGRSFYTGMGRTAESYADANFREHLLGAIQWSAGLLRGNCKATINANYESTRLTEAGPTSTGLATSGESHGLVVAPNGWVIYIGRADCRTDAERGNVFQSNPIGRVLDYASENAGMGCGSVHVWDPAQHNGEVNSGVTRAGVLAVHGDMGQGGERTNEPNHKIETGLLGITLSPDFMETGHIYLQYFPSFNPTSTPPGLPLERRISKMSQGRISRFTLNLQTKQLDLSSEVRIFEYDSQIFSCCHRGGGMGFDSDGNLYITTGDSNSSQGTGGYSGNNQPPKCPIGPPDQASSAHCGTAAYSYQDARRTAGNTNDYNGKMLRIRPIEGVARGNPGRHRLDLHDPGRGRAERAEPVQRRRGQRQPGEARDLRHGPAQPVAAVDRPRDRRPLLGLGRPGRGGAERDARPVDLRERGAAGPRRQLWLAVLHGQQAGVPRPHGGAEPAGQRHPADDQRGRIRVRRPGHRGDRRLVRLRQHRQRLDEQHGPHPACSRTAPERAWTRARCGRRTSGTAVGTPAATAARSSRASAARRTRPTTARRTRSCVRSRSAPARRS